MKILAVDASTEACSVALYLDGDCRQEYAVEPRRHTELILPMVDRLLHEAGIALSALDAIAFDRGPGAFTGVRVGTSVAQGLAFSSDLPVAPVSSLATLAQGASREKQQSRILSMIDARMGEVYWACFEVENGLVSLIRDEQLSPADRVYLDGPGWYACGSGWAAGGQELSDRLSVQLSSVMPDPYRLPQAQDVARLACALVEQGHTVSAEQALPVYLRDDVAWQKQSV